MNIDSKRHPELSVRGWIRSPLDRGTLDFPVTMSLHARTHYPSACTPSDEADFLAAVRRSRRLHRG